MDLTEYIEKTALKVDKAIDRILVPHVMILGKPVLICFLQEVNASDLPSFCWQRTQ